MSGKSEHIDHVMGLMAGRQCRIVNADGLPYCLAYTLGKEELIRNVRIEFLSGYYGKKVVEAKIGVPTGFCEAQGMRDVVEGDNCGAGDRAFFEWLCSLGENKTS